MLKKSLILAALFASACASKSPLKNDKQHFYTRISDSGLKHFELRNMRKKNQPPQTPRSNRKTSRSTDPAQVYEYAKKRMENQAKAVIEENNYCRDGFWIIEFERDIEGLYMRGECYDTASTEDRKKFPDTISNW